MSPVERSAQSLLAQVRATLRERQLLRDEKRILVACSGGPDSQALLHVLWTLRAEHGCELLAASVDHGLRLEAAAEMALARELAQRLGLPFHALRVQVPEGASLQAQARAVRYAALRQCAARHDAGCIAVGHTLDDQAETVLARILRGTGVEGLSGIEPRRADGVIRPMIDAPRSAVRAYVREHNLAAARDPSNDDERFLRVRLRSAVLPLLRRENPRLIEALGHLAEDAREMRDAWLAQVDACVSQARNDVAILRTAPQALRRRALRRWVELELGTALHRQHLVALERMLWVGGEVRLPGGVAARLDDSGRLTFAPVSKRGRGG